MNSVMDEKASRAGRKACRKGKHRERELAKIFSLWWTRGEDRNAFRRTPVSGGWPRKRSHGDIIPVSQEAVSFPFIVDVKDRQGVQGIEFVDLLENERSPIFVWFDELTKIIQENFLVHSGKHRLLVVHKNRKDYCIVGRKEMEFLSDRAGVIPHVKVAHPWRWEVLYLFPLSVLLSKDPSALRISGVGRSDAAFQQVGTE